MSSYEFCVSGFDFGFRVSSFGFRVSGFGFRVSAFGSQISGSAHTLTDGWWQGIVDDDDDEAGAGSNPLGPYGRTLLRALRWSCGGVLFLMNEVPLYTDPPGVAGEGADRAHGADMLHAVAVLSIPNATVLSILVQKVRHAPFLFGVSARWWQGKALIAHMARLALALAPDHFDAQSVSPPLYMYMYISCVYVYIYMYVCMYVSMYVCMHVCMYLFLYVCMYV